MTDERRETEELVEKVARLICSGYRLIEREPFRKARAAIAKARLAHPTETGE